MRVALGISYSGSRYHGWQSQLGGQTVQDALESALQRFATVPIRTLCAGRTDAGVHARGGVCHVDLDDSVWQSLPGRSARTPDEALVARLAGVLPRDVVVRSAQQVPTTFDARFSALKRRYSYRLLDDASRLDPLRRRDTVVVKRPLDVEAMTDAASALTGLRDFAAFCKRREGATTIRTLLHYSWRRDGDGVIIGRIEADAFCHSMVRALVGVVVPVGEGRKPVGWPAQVLGIARRDPGVVVMPAHGLCLEEVSYPPRSEYAARDAASRVMRTAADLPGA